MTDHLRVNNTLLIARALPAGSAVILRDYTLPKRGALAVQLKSVCASRNLILLIGNDATLAKNVAADGVHWPSWSTPLSLPRGMISTCACHDTADLERAHRAGADAAFLSPVFETGSHPGAVSLGIKRFRDIAATAKLPVLALGGITSDNAMRVRHPNVSGLGAISAFQDGPPK